MFTTEGTPCIVDGKKLKNQIYFKCKKVAHYKSILDKQGLKISNRIQKINNKFKGLQNNFLNQTVNFIIEKCKKQNVGTIILRITTKNSNTKATWEKNKTKYSHT